MTKKELRKTAQKALRSEYGFAPALSKITLFEAHSDGEYILFRVEDKEYSFDSFMTNNGVWVGKGTITKRN